MGELYEFDCRMIDGRVVHGFVYSNESTGWNEVFVEFDEEQKAEAEKIWAEMDGVKDKQISFLKGIIS